MTTDTTHRSAVAPVSRVDVLAVLDAAYDLIDDQIEAADEILGDIGSARAAVAELIAHNAELVSAVNGLLNTMECQERREAGQFHISANTASLIWDGAKSRARAALLACGGEQ